MLLPRAMPTAFGWHARTVAISETNTDWHNSRLIRKGHATGCRIQADRLFGYRPYSQGNRTFPKHQFCLALSLWRGEAKNWENRGECHRYGTLEKTSLFL